MAEQTLSKSLLKTVYTWVRKTETKMKAILSGAGKSNTKIFQQLKIVVETKNNQITISDKLPSYAVFVDQGRKPGKQPPLRTIEDWCKRKGIDKSAAFPIARKIGERGLKATNFMKPLKDFQKLIAELKIESIKYVKDDIHQQVKEINQNQKNK